MRLPLPGRPHTRQAPWSRAITRGAQAGKISLVSDLPGVTGEAKAFLKLSLPAATKTPQGNLAGPIERRG